MPVLHNTHLNMGIGIEAVTVWVRGNADCRAVSVFAARPRDVNCFEGTSRDREFVLAGITSRSELLNDGGVAYRSGRRVGHDLG